VRAVSNTRAKPPRELLGEAAARAAMVRHAGGSPASRLHRDEARRT
jgi:hypothetical protein